MIIQLSSPLFISKIIELAKIVENAPLPALEKMILSGINDKESIIYIAEKDGEVKGFIFCSIEQWNGELVAFIQFCVVKPIREEKYIGFELLNKVRIWAKERGLKDLIFVTKRNPRLFERKYSFKPDGFILKREV